MQPKLPNLELLEYQAMETFINNKELLKIYCEKQKNKNGFQLSPKKVRHIPMNCEMFIQTWGNTCTAFDVDENNHSVVSGCALTNAYTTVFYEPITEIYIVFIDNRLCYQVSNANERFLSDLKNHCLQSLSSAKKLY